ncbi:MAG: FxsA family protein [Betaproteobacteria bacterium]
MRFIILAIVLAFPLADLYLTARIARWSGIPLWVWLGGSFVAGALLLGNERNQFRMKTVAALHGGQPVLRGLLDSGRRVLAGLLLMLPGIASDVVALVLLALPLNVGQVYEPLAAGAARWPRHRKGDAIDGDYRRID